MKLSESRQIKASREEVFAALNDPEVLQKAVQGCESMEKTGEGEYKAVVSVKVGPVKAKFSGNVTLSDIVPPESYTISGSGTGGAAGMASGGAKVRLTEENGITTLHYDVEAKTSGKLAQLGSRVIMSVAKSQADKFFAAFASIVEGEEAAEPAVEEKRKEEKSKIANPWLWVAFAAALALVYYYLAK